MFHSLKGGGKPGKHKRRSAGQEQLARSLLGELVMTESTKNLLYEIEKDGFDNSCDGAEKEGACTRSVVQRQYTISKIKKKVGYCIFLYPKYNSYMY